MRFFQLSPVALCMALAGCQVAISNPDDTVNEIATYQITVTNLTNAQPFSPLVASISSEQAPWWRLGEAASNELELIAEGGDNSGLVASAMAAGHDYAAADMPIMPGAMQQLVIDVSQAGQTAKHINLATMLVNTNDAMTGLAAYDISSLMPGKSVSMNLAAYDAGTEYNSEQASTIPGPAGMGEGLNAARDDVNFVHVHAGVISQDDGLIDSALSVSHRFDNPVAKVEIVRVK